MRVILSQAQKEQFFNNNGKTNCATCMVEMDHSDELVKRVCGHVFHDSCDKLWSTSASGMGKGCPICRQGRQKKTDLTEAEDPFVQELFDRYGDEPITSSASRKNRDFLTCVIAMVGFGVTSLALMVASTVDTKFKQISG